MISSWPCPLPNGAVSEELLFSCGAGGASGEARESAPNILIIPPLFGEHNLMRRQLALLMRRLADEGVNAHLPDLPGWNESPQPAETQTLAHWRAAIPAAAEHLNANHMFAVRSGALLLGPYRPATVYAPQSGAKLLRDMMRAQTLSDKEAGVAVSRQEMKERGRAEGIRLAGWSIGAQLFCELEQAEPPETAANFEITQEQLGSPGLWLRAEPGENAAQAGIIARILTQTLANAEAANP